MTTRTGLAVTAVAAAVLARSHFIDWGSRPAERAARLPGDELVAEPAESHTLAVTVHAPADVVWAWLVQIGQDRGGWYSYDWLENLFGLDIHSTDLIRPEWQDVRVGDRIVLMRPGPGPLRNGYSIPVALLAPGRALVLRQRPPEHPWDGVWSFHVLPDGPRTTRLVSRTRTRVRSGAAGTRQRLLDEPGRPVTALMTRRMLLGIKQRAERAGSAAQRPDVVDTVSL
jgi:hypothetical protein